MKYKMQIPQFVIICILICTGLMHLSLLQGTGLAAKYPSDDISVVSFFDDVNNKSSEVVEKLNGSLLSFLTTDDLVNGKLSVERLLQLLSANKISDSLLCESYYLIGIYNLKSRSYNAAIHYLNLCVSIKEKRAENDIRYSRAIYNLSVAYYNLGELNKFEDYALKSLEIGKTIYGESNPGLLTSYLSLVIALIDLTEYEKALSNANIAVTIATKNPGTTPPSLLADFYYNIGVCYSRLGDLSKAKIYLDKAESIYRNSDLEKNDNFINLMNGLANTYHSLGLDTESGEYYQKGVTLAISRNSSLAYNIINSYSAFLAENNETGKGEKLLINALDRAKSEYKINPKNYYEVLFYYAAYLRVNKIDLEKSVKCYEKCLDYLKMNGQNNFFRTLVYMGYSSALKEEGESVKALGIIQSLLFSNRENQKVDDNLENPAVETLRPDITSLRILKIKYNILWDIYKKIPDHKTLEAASNTSELIVSLLDKVRINISEEESRLILGDRYRDLYLNAIRDFYLLYKKTNDRHFLEKAFEYSEKSKVAGLLASTRELKATQFHIPSNIGNYEKELQGKISFYNAHISEVSSGEKPDAMLIASWKENLLEFTRKRDSLILIFEKEYPDYYALKYNTHVVGINDIPEVVGKDGNYINYVISDTVLYTFIVNRNYKQLLTIHIDTSFFNEIKEFRSLLSMPSPSDNASLKFKEFQTVGYKLYKILIDPIRSYIVSDKLIISPDNILSYLPFETIPGSAESPKNNNYRDLNYLLNSFDISYTYSATFTAESEKKEYSRSNKLVAFAPDYPEPIDIQSALKSRQEGMGVLNDLPYARQEAEYISDITGGKLFENSDAKESVFKKESGKYDIIHLSMHTLLNDKDPMHSTLIFSHKNDSLEDGYLNTYEIYGIPLKAKMVVLSSCNTGSGLLSTGEGILSLARGFIFSGSQSVIMSMWEIEDRSGTEIVEMFYKNLKNGYPKSIALKRARITFLENADLLRSHPYFWSSLVVYGNNSPLYHSKRMKILVVAIVAVIVFSLGFYYFKRKYS